MGLLTRLKSLTRTAAEPEPDDAVRRRAVMQQLARTARNLEAALAAAADGCSPEGGRVEESLRLNVDDLCARVARSREAGCTKADEHQLKELECAASRIAASLADLRVRKAG